MCNHCRFADYTKMWRCFVLSYYLLFLCLSLDLDLDLDLDFDLDDERDLKGK